MRTGTTHASVGLKHTKKVARWPKSAVSDGRAPRGVVLSTSSGLQGKGGASARAGPWRAAATPVAPLLWPRSIPPIRHPFRPPQHPPPPIRRLDSWSPSAAKTSLHAASTATAGVHRLKRAKPGSNQQQTPRRRKGRDPHPPRRCPLGRFHITIPSMSRHSIVGAARHHAPCQKAVYIDRKSVV